MNAEHATSDSAAVIQGSPGAAIRSARTRAGLSLEELASRTRLTRQTLEAMEADAFEQLLEPVYVRGYYRKCARILEIPDQPLVDAYDRMYSPPPKAAPQRLRLASGGDLGSSPRFSTRLAILAPLAAIVLISIIWMLRESSTSTVPPASVTMIEPGIDGSGAVLGPDAVPAPTDSTEGAAPAGAGSAAAPDGSQLGATVSPDGTTPAPAADPNVNPALVAGTPAATAPAEPAAPPAPRPVGTVLVLEFQEISWARVEDASGKSLLSGVISPGDTQTLDGKAPYSVFLGNAPGVKVTFGGVPVDVKPFVKGNSTARFSVPAAGAN
jgi:cytoskeleton protein RodZ